MQLEGVSKYRLHDFRKMAAAADQVYAAVDVQTSFCNGLLGAHRKTQRKKLLTMSGISRPRVIPLMPPCVACVRRPSVGGQLADSYWTANAYVSPEATWLSHPVDVCPKLSPVARITPTNEVVVPSTAGES